MTRPEETLMFAEAAEAAAVAERQSERLEGLMRQLAARLRQMDPAMVITCARGSSDHAATYAKYLIETRVQTPVASYAPSVSSAYATSWRKLEGSLFLAISQSGQSPDLLVSARAARDAGAFVVAIVNQPHSPLSEIAESTIPMLAGPEQSVAATKSYIASLLAIVQLVSVWTGDEELSSALRAAPQALRQSWQLDWSPALPCLMGARNLYVLGRGLTLAIAQEAALKLKETCGLHAEAYSAAEVKHGPMAIVRPGFPVLMFEPNDEAGEAFEPLAEELKSNGAILIRAGGDKSGALDLPIVQGLHPALAPIAAISSFYKLAAVLSVARGFDPDRPPHLRKVTETR